MILSVQYLLFVRLRSRLWSWYLLLTQALAAIECVAAYENLHGFINPEAAALTGFNCRIIAGA